MLKLKLSKKIMEKVNNNCLKSVELVTFVLENVKNTSTEKELNKTALKDINFNGKYCNSVYLDKFTSILHIEF